MRTRFTWLGIIAAVVIGITAVFVSCQKELNDIVIYRGEVVYKNTTNPFPNLTVKVTNGTDTHCQTLTDDAGQFSLKVRVNEIDGNYYLLAGDSTCVPKMVALGGYGQAEVDLGVIEVEGPALPTVVTDSIVRDITADAAVIGGEVLTDGRMTVTARGICYGTSSFPTVDGLHTNDGTGLGTFTSHLKNLEHDAIYYARAYATNKLGTAYGEQVKFTTEEGVPVVQTDTIINITANSARCVGYVVSDGGYAVTARGTCWSTHHDPTIYDNCTNDGSGLKEFTSVLTNLQENTTYYVRAYATNSTTTKYGEEKEFTTLDGLAKVRTDSLTNCTATSFMAYGTVLADCDIPVTERGFCYSTSQYPTIDGKHIAVNKGLGSFHATISDLEYATTYYVRAYATNATATVYDSLQLEITTLTGLPTVVTDSVVTNIGSVKASCHGEVTDDGTLSVTARGICYGTEPQLTINDAHTDEGRGKGEFTSNLKNLKDSTVYYYRAYATTNAGTAYGKEYSFMTKNGVPVVKLEEVGKPTANSVICKGNVTGDGGVSITERGFCYGTSQYPTNTDSHVAIGNGTGEFTGSLTNLSINTTYYIRAYAVNSLGVGYSAQQSFTTHSGLPTITTSQPTSTATTISVGGEVTDNGGYAVSERGVCYSTTNSEPTIADQKVVSGRGNGTFNLAITGLAASTTYFVRAYAINENGTAYGNALTITTKNGVAIVTAGTITNITALSATGSVTVTDANGANLQSCGICWATTPNPTIENNNVAGGNQINTAYSCNMTNLVPNTKYYVRAYATTDITTTYSEQVTFSTVNGLPVVTTGTPTTTATTITANGDVTDNGGYNVTERGFCYSTTNSEPTILDPKVANGSGKGAFSITISELQPSTTYYIRAYATNSIGTAYGDVVSIMTKSGMATVITGAISNVKALTATGDVSVSDAGGALLLSCGICWSTIPNPTVTDNKSAGGNQLNTQYACNMTSLTPNTTYYVRAYAITDIATAYGEEVSYKTTTGLPALSTNTTTATSTIITSGGDIISDGGYSIIERGICYSTSNSLPTTSDQHISNGTGTGTYSCVIANVSVSTIYYVRAYATNNIGTAYGDVMTVQTGDGLPSVSTTDVGENLTESTAIAGGNITSDGGYSVTQRGVCWSTTPYPTISDGKTTDGSGTGYYSSTITGINLNDNTIIYYIRAYATNINGTAYGNQITLRKENLEYKNLPTFTYGGYKYHLYYDMGSMTREQGKQECQNLVFSGHNDWYLPNFTELRTAAEAQVGGWVSTTADGISTYWCSTQTVDFPYYYDYIVKVQVSADGIGTLYQAYSFLGGDGVARVFRIRAVRKDPVQ